jgi:CDP-diglyceride synthetase
MNWLIITLFVLGCLAAYKAFNAEDPKQRKLFGVIALFIGGMLFVLGNPGIFK